MKKINKTMLAVLLLLCGCVSVGLVLTRDEGVNSAEISRSTERREQQTVDQTPLRTARLAAGLATTNEERAWAREAFRISDHEVDLAFSTALRQATQQPNVPEVRVRDLQAAVKRASAAVAADKANVRVLSEKEGANAEPEQLELAQAQLALDQNELEDAREDLSRAGGDAASKIQRMLEEHEALQHGGSVTTVENQSNSDQANNLVAELRTFAAVRAEIQQLQLARGEAIQSASWLTSKHDALAQKVNRERAERTVPARNAIARELGSRANEVVSPSATLVALKRFSEDEKTLAEYDRRIQDEQELAEVYGKWMGATRVRLDSSIHSSLQSVLWIVILAMVVVFANAFIEHLFSDLPSDRRRFLSARTVLHFVTNATGAVLILFVVFGRPAQMSTILGLAGAGLTIALKDFIVGFFGWFVLMGRNGIRVGDWVEINGVVGEVLEIGPLRTILLETGNWTDSGHPTGRKVAFVNSFAIEGHFFNFSTSGQWLWDELQVTIMADRDPYDTLEKIRDLVLQATEINGRLAEQELRRVTQKYGVHNFSIEPVVELRPVSSGVDVVIRYLTRAPERYELKSRLCQELVALLHTSATSEKGVAARSST